MPSLAEAKIQVIWEHELRAANAALHEAVRVSENPDATPEEKKRHS